MAEFREVMAQFARLCDYYSQNGCHGCPVDEEGFNCACKKQGCSKSSAEDLEAIIMSWAAEHPEPVYPTWIDVMKMYGVTDETGYCYLDSAYKPIPADIAEKLGIEPKGEA